MTDIFCYNIHEIYLENDLEPCHMKYVISVTEYDSEVVVTSASKIIGLKRGWFGTLNCKTNKGVNIDMDEIKDINPIHCIKDVVFKEVQIDSEINNTTQFKYVFTKI